MAVRRCGSAPSVGSEFHPAPKRKLPVSTNESTRAWKISAFGIPLLEVAFGETRIGTHICQRNVAVVVAGDQVSYVKGDENAIHVAIVAVNRFPNRTVFHRFR